MLFIPAQLSNGSLLLILVIEKDNLERMQQADPFDMQLRDYPLPLVPVSRLQILLAYEEDVGPIKAFQEKNDWAGLLAHIQRNPKLQPGDGGKPQSWNTGGHA